MKVLAINPGSTSTKIAVYDENGPVYENTIRHDADEVGKYSSVVEQFEFRKRFIEDTLEKAGVALNRDHMGDQKC